MSSFFIVFKNKNFKAFFTLLSFVEKIEKIATNLTDRLFSHFFITIGNILSNYINPTNAVYNIINTNFFAYIVTNQFLFDKFHEIIIDINVSKHFIADYKQFMAYTRIIKNTTINISKAS